jgi:hypothetical protein
MFAVCAIKVLLDRRAFQKAHHRGHALLWQTGDVHVVGAGFFERQPDEFASALNLGPVIELVAHRGSPPAWKFFLLPNKN